MKALFLIYLLEGVIADFSRSVDCYVVSAVRLIDLDVTLQDKNV